MVWSDVAMMVFACTMANHLGLIEAVERTVGFRLPIVNCCKCCSFWATLGYCAVTDYDAIASVAMSFLAAYVAIWLELGLGFIDTIYNKAYGWIYNEAAFTAMDGCNDSADTADADHPQGALSEVRLSNKDFE